MDEQVNQRLHVVVEGYVQGVGFRAFVEKHAAPLKLTGWVRNVSSGEVELLAEGSRPALETLLDHLRAGPRSGSLVTNLQIEWQPATGEFTDFRVIRTLYL